MASLNKVMLIGNLGKDPESRTLSTGAIVATFPIATTERYTDQSGEKKENTEWHNIELWDAQAKIAMQYLKKGSPVYIEGKIKTDSWEDNGVKKYATKIRGLSLQLLGSNPNSGERTETTTYSEKQKSDPISTTTEVDDLPF